MCKIRLNEYNIDVVNISVQHYYLQILIDIYIYK